MQVTVQAVRSLNNGMDFVRYTRSEWVFRITHNIFSVTDRNQLHFKIFIK